MSLTTIHSCFGARFEPPTGGSEPACAICWRFASQLAVATAPDTVVKERWPLWTSQLRLCIVTLCLFARSPTAVHGQVQHRDPTPNVSLRATGPSFVVHSFASGPNAAEVLQLATRVRADVFERWCPDAPTEGWQPRCQVVLHPSRSEYVRAVGPAGGQTSDASLIEHAGGRVVKRRIDLVVDGRGRYSALAHELTHVVLADWFRGRQPPPWVDEGIATQTDALDKQARNRRDCRQALTNGTAMQLIELMSLAQLSSRQQAAAFYGQSLSLVRLLSGRRAPAKLLPFVDRAQTHGFDRALRDIYEIDGIGELQRLWLKQGASDVRGAALQASFSQ